MTLGNRIARYRKEKALTQEALAQLLDVTNQAVSKWEADQCCPDIMLLPKIADVFAISLDTLFERESRQTFHIDGLPWENDDTLRVALYQGHRLLKHNNGEKELFFRYEGPALNIDSMVSVNCCDVNGNVDAGASVCCACVDGYVDAGGSVNCGPVGGYVDAGGSVNCGPVGSYVDAGGHVECGDVGGNVDAGSSVRCKNVGGDVDAGTHVTCESVSGDVDAGGDVTIG